MENLVLYAPAGGALALLFALYLSSKVKKADTGTERMVEISNYIHEGAMAFLSRQYRAIAIFVVIVFLGLGLVLPENSWKTAISFIVGATCSALAGYIGMTVATKANVRTANAARSSQNAALGIAFSGGAVMGMSVTGLGLLGLGILYIIFRDPTIVNGFALGASSIALFGRVGGGIYTKAADVGADLVGKVEAGIPEDDPRNPATIADNVGDNVGDVAGMGADLFESYVGSIIAAMTLGMVGFAAMDIGGILLPMVIAAGGVLASIIGTFFVRTDENSNPLKALNAGTFGSAAILLVIAFLAVKYILPAEFFNVFWSIVAGLIAGTLIGLITEYYTSDEYKPVQGIAKSAQTGPATTIIAGLGVGMLSTLFPIAVICIAIMIAFLTGGVYGIAMAAVGMLATTGMVVAVDAYGPIADNAGGIAEMAELPHEVRETTDRLDSVGNTTAAIGKGFAIGSAALTALALLTAFAQVAGIQATDLSLLNPEVIVGLLFGAMLPFFFSALTMGAVGRAAAEMVNEVRRQFREIPGIMEGTGKPDYAKCVDISTSSAIKEMIIPGVLAVVAPLAMGLWNVNALAGMLAGALASGVCLAIMLANAGGAWDNAKKFIEAGNYGGKGSEAHAAGVVGDTVGDPCKDTSGPSLNILIKLMTIVSLVLIPLFL
ncbi:MAG TPA: sodium-translocating pyrophosphatase [Syntrophomonadaceae bacterium]|nr:sodium-translocating pyrophosphatase [Syntrophomonadaceae bacterium]